MKWVGGKRQLLDNILPLLPKSYSTYYEPFVGGGAVFFHLQPRNAVINDFNEELINAYQMVQMEPDALIELLEHHRINNSEEYFYEIRQLDRQKSIYDTLSPLEKAARTIYLNKTCYNGLYRVNSAGQFNAPYGRYKNPNIINEVGLRAVSTYLNENRIQILCGDYRKALEDINKGDFVYLDPPYMPISSSASFTAYTANGFGTEEQLSLKHQCDLLNKKGIHFLESNSCCDFIEDLYKDYIVTRVSAKRAINSCGDKRGAIDEVLIRNYE